MYTVAPSRTFMTNSSQIQNKCKPPTCVHRLSVNVHMLPVAERGSKPRNNALCTVCCMETIYVSLCDTTNRAFLNPIQFPRAFVHHLLSVPLCTIFQVLRMCTQLSDSVLRFPSIMGNNVPSMQGNHFPPIEGNRVPLIGGNSVTTIGGNRVTTIMVQCAPL